jgi:hypothetical protein
LPELVTVPLSVRLAVVDATGEASGEAPHAASATDPPSTTNAKNREDVCMSSS